MKTADPFEILRANDPVDPEEIARYAAAHAESVKLAILATDRFEVEAPVRRGWRRRSVRIVAAIAGVAAVAATWAVLTRDVSIPVVSCYAAASLDADRVGLGAPDSLDASQCAPVWDAGDLVNLDVAPAGAVPPLVACVSDGGALAVFPGTDAELLCGGLGLAVPDAESVTDLAPAIDLRDALFDYFAARPCIPLDEAEADVAELLAARGLGDWAVQVMPGPADRPCASYALDAPGRLIRLVPIPRPGG